MPYRDFRPVSAMEETRHTSTQTAVLQQTSTTWNGGGRRVTYVLLYTRGVPSLLLDCGESLKLRSGQSRSDQPGLVGGGERAAVLLQDSLHDHIPFYRHRPFRHICWSRVFSACMMSLGRRCTLYMYRSCKASFGKGNIPHNIFEINKHRIECSFTNGKLKTC